MDLNWREGVFLSAVGVVLLVILALCTSPKEPSFTAHCNDFCQALDSKVAFCDEAKRTLVCE